MWLVVLPNSTASHTAQAEPGPTATVDELNKVISPGDLDLLKEVVDTGLDPNTVDDLGYTSLATVVTLSEGIKTSNGQANILLHAGADPQSEK